MKNQKTAQVWNRIALLIFVVLIGCESILLWQIWRLNMLPGKYFMILSGFLLAMTGFIGLLLFRKMQGKWNKKAGWARQIVSMVLALVMIGGCFFGNLAVGQVLGTIGAITSPEKVNVILEIYVRQEDPAQYLQDTAVYTFAMGEDIPEDVAENMLRELEESLGKPANILPCSGTVAAVDALLSGQVDALILDSAYLLVFEDMAGYENLESKIRMLEKYVIEKQLPKEENNRLPNWFKSGDITTEPFLLYISGNDARRELLADGGSDVNILVVVNPVDHQILLVNTPRDYYVVNPASGNGSRDKLSHCGLRGIENCILAMEGQYEISIDYYARINFSGFRTLIDAIGGVTVYSDITFNAGDYLIHQGENHLNGDKALSFARERKNLSGGDNDRGKNQMKLISAMIKQLSAGNLLSNYSEILKSLEGMFSTNLPAEDIGKLVRLQLTEMPDWEILTFAVTGDNGNDICWAAGGYGYVMYPHEHMVAHAQNLINRVLAGEVLTNEDLTVNP